LQQAAVWSATTYLALAAGGAAAVEFGAWRATRGRVAFALVIGLGLAALVFAATGWRAQSRLAERLPAALEGRDITLTGVVAELPRNLPDGVRFEFAVEGAAAQGRPVALPARVSLGWYRGFADDEARLLEPFTTLRAGQRWQFTVRLKQPHGTRNPHGFDYELWAFEQGLGASGYVLKDSPSAQLVAAVRDAFRGGSYLSPRMLSQLVDDFRSRIKTANRMPRFATLTSREREVLKMLAEGQSVKEIACDLNLSVKTVEAHKFNLMRKLDIHNKAQLVQYAIQKKIIKIPNLA